MRDRQPPSADRAQRRERALQVRDEVVGVLQSGRDAEQPAFIGTRGDRAFRDRRNHQAFVATPRIAAPEELGRIDMQVAKLSSAIEEFTISIEKSGTGGLLKFEWEKTSASVKFSAK